MKYSKRVYKSSQGEYTDLTSFKLWYIFREKYLFRNNIFVDIYTG